MDQPKWTDFKITDLKLDVDAVLRGQGADPLVVRGRKPKLVETASLALETARNLLNPRVTARQFKILSVRHNRIDLEDGFTLKGEWITSQLAGAEYLVAIVCTVGSAISDMVTQTIREDILIGLAIDGVGSAGVEALGQMVCSQIEEHAATEGFQTTIPYSPGMIEWPVEDGQPQIFGLLESENLSVNLTSSMVMIPSKSLSMLVGMGVNIAAKGVTCDYCAMQGTCKYRATGGHANARNLVIPE